MRTFAFLIAFAAGLALAQEPKGYLPPQDGHQPNDSQNCQMKCASEMTKCMDPCMPKNQADLDKPGAKTNTAACAKRCATAQQPCMEKCNQTKGKKGKSGGGDEP